MPRLGVGPHQQRSRFGRQIVGALIWLRIPGERRCTGNFNELGRIICLRAKLAGIAAAARLNLGVQSRQELREQHNGSGLSRWECLAILFNSTEVVEVNLEQIPSDEHDWMYNSRGILRFDPNKFSKMHSKSWEELKKDYMGIYKCFNRCLIGQGMQTSFLRLQQSSLCL